MNGWSDFKQIWYAGVSYDVLGSYRKWIRLTNICSVATPTEFFRRYGIFEKWAFSTEFLRNSQISYGKIP